jgi:hypothetical protein
MNAFLAIMSSSATSITFSPFQCILWRLRVSSVRLPNAKERNGLRLIAFEIKCLRCGSSGSCAPWIFVDGIAARARSVIRSRDGVGFKSLNSKGRHSSPHVRQISIWTGDGKAISASRTWSLIIHFVPRLLNEDSHARSYPPQSIHSKQNLIFRISSPWLQHHNPQIQATPIRRVVQEHEETERAPFQSFFVRTE